jgi:class 3 adenylate cyclase
MLIVRRPMADILEAGTRKRKLAAILHADVVGFSRLMGLDEAGTHQALGELRGALDPLIVAHGGRIVGTAGDSLLADFTSVVEAVSCGMRCSDRRGRSMIRCPLNAGSSCGSASISAM